MKDITSINVNDIRLCQCLLFFICQAYTYNNHFYLQLSQPEIEQSSQNIGSTNIATSPLTLVGSDKANGNVDYVANPDFNSQEYYNWLSNFTELSKLVPVPLDVDLFQKISQVLYLIGEFYLLEA